MKEEIKQKLNAAKEFVSEHESIIATGLWVAGCFTFGKLIANSFVAISNARAANAYQVGVDACWDQLIVDNQDNPEFIKMLSDFAVKHPVLYNN